MKPGMTQPIPPLNEEEIEKQYMYFFEFGNQLREVVEQTLSVKAGTSKSLEKVIAHNIRLIKGLIKDYQMALKDRSGKYNFWGWVEPDRHLEYLARINAALKIYTMLTGNDAAQVRQKLSELEDEVYKTLGAIYTTIVNEKKDRINIIQKIISKKAKARAKEALVENNTTICKLKVVSKNAQDETLKMLLNIESGEAKNLEQELINFINEKIEITNVSDLLKFMKKVSKLLERSAAIEMLSRLIEDVDEEFAAEADLVSSAYFAYDRLRLLAEDLRGREIDNYEWFMRTCADEELSKYYVNECKSLNS
ncbi:MAG: hypothetical protein QXH07_05905 [Thermoplasmata archaeon]